MMIRKFVSLILPVLLLNLSIGTVLAKPNLEKEKLQAAKVKQAIFKLGAGEKSLVNIKLRDKTKVEGFVSQINDATFIVMNNQTGVATEVAYPNVKQVRGNNLSTKTKILIGVGIAVAVLVIIAAVNGNIGGRNRTLEEALRDAKLP